MRLPLSVLVMAEGYYIGDACCGAAACDGQLKLRGAVLGISHNFWQRAYPFTFSIMWLMTMLCSC